MQLKFGKPKNLDDASPPDTRTFTIVNRIRLKSAFKCSPRRKVSNEFFKPHSVVVRIPIKEIFLITKITFGEICYENIKKVEKMISFRFYFRVPIKRGSPLIYFGKCLLRKQFFYVLQKCPI